VEGEESVQSESKNLAIFAVLGVFARNRSRTLFRAKTQRLAKTLRRIPLMKSHDHD